MAADDRDPRKHRHSSLVADRRTRAPASGRFGRLLLLVILGLAIAYWLGKRDGLSALQRLSGALSSPDVGEAIAPASLCGDAFPFPGTVSSSTDWRPRAAAVSLTTFANRTPYDRIVDLLRGEQVLLSIAVPANSDSIVELPLGAHDWRLRNGAAWCGRDWRFVREQRTMISPPLEIVASSQLTVDISPDPEHPTGFALRTRDAPIISSTSPPPAAATGSGDGTLLLPRSASGHYFVDGTVDGEPVRFLVDTGASRIALPVTLARRLGYYQGREVIVNTASGPTTASEFRVKRITFGPFSTEDVTVVAMMNLETPLLGMSLLQSIELRQTPAGLELRQTR